MEYSPEEYKDMIKGHFTEAIYPKSEYLKQDFKIQETRTDTLGRDEGTKGSQCLSASPSCSSNMCPQGLLSAIR